MIPSAILNLVARRPAAVAGILIGALIPVFGVVFLGWDAAQILILYWVENVVLGVLTLPRLIVATRGGFGGLFLAGFFVVHYGLFCMGHLVFALLIVGDLSDGNGGWFAALPDIVSRPGFLWGALGVAGLNLVGQVRDWWLPGLWRTADPTAEMTKPYGRIVVLHLTVLLGAGVVLGFHGPAGAILVLCLMKAGLELGLLAWGDLFRTDVRKRH